MQRLYVSMLTHSDLQPCRRCSGCILAQSELLWGTDLSSHPCGPAQLQPDMIIGSDITYDEAQFQPLLQTISAYLDHCSDVKVCLLCMALSLQHCCIHCCAPTIHMPYAGQLKAMRPCLFVISIGRGKLHCCIQCLRLGVDKA